MSAHFQSSRIKAGKKPKKSVVQLKPTFTSFMTPVLGSYNFICIISTPIVFPISV